MHHGAVLVFHAIQELLDRHQVTGRDILYLSLETPLFTGLSLEGLVARIQKLFARPAGATLYIFFDEIQCLKGWEIHLKSLGDTYRNCRFVATGAAAAALKTKSVEFGAGRFTEFVLPPLTFAEYLRFIGRETELIREYEGTAGAQREYELLAELAARHSCAPPAPDANYYSSHPGPFRIKGLVAFRQAACPPPAIFLA